MDNDDLIEKCGNQQTKCNHTKKAHKYKTLNAEIIDSICNYATCNCKGFITNT